MASTIRLYVGGALALAAGVALILHGDHDVGVALAVAGAAELGVKTATPV
jgi:hypothetical protein